MNKYVRRIIGTLIIIVPSLILLGFLLNMLSGKSFYSNSGSVTVRGITSQVKIYSDDYGVPHIIASNNEDMYFALGYMHAQDRLWQMDLTRRVAEGRLSEIFGSSTLEFDKLYRTIGINRFAYRWFEKLSPESKKYLLDYSDGVNAFIEENYENLPVEFDILNYRPEYWKPEHSLMVTRMIGWELNLAWYTDYILGEIVNKTGLEKTAEIFPDTTFSIFEKPVEIIDSLGVDTTEMTALKNSEEISILGRDFFRAYGDYRRFFNINCAHAGSNSWVVAGSKSETGKPLMANDPHLAFMAPSKWYEVHLKSSLADVIGMSLPGVPGIAIGHNRQISWSLTNLMNDDTDFFILERDQANANSYIYLGVNYMLDSIKEVITVKDSNEVEIVVRNTVLGPVISELPTRGFISNKIIDLHKDKILTFKWTGFEYSDEISAFYKINTARNWNEFKNGLKEFCTPAQNFMYADTAGNIGYKAAGKVPIRKTGYKNDCIYPAISDMVWTGFIDFNELPEMYNPKDSFMVTANTNPFEWLKTEPGSRFYISYIWEPESRRDRIHEILSGGSKFNVNEFKLIQASYTSVYAREISDYLLNAFSDPGSIDNLTSRALNILRNSKGEMAAGDAAGSIYSAFLVVLLRNIYIDELGKDVFHDFLLIPNLPLRSTLLMLKNYSSENPLWFDNINTAEIETRDQIIRTSFMNALIFLKSKFGNADADSWHWGSIHKVTFSHPLGIIPELAGSFNIGPFEVGGDQTAINNSEYSFNNAFNEGDFRNILGSSMRMIVDLSNMNNTYTVNSTGQNGQPLHPNYSDQTRLWLLGDSKIVVMNETDMLDKDYNLLMLVPEE